MFKKVLKFKKTYLLQISIIFCAILLIIFEVLGWLSAIGVMFGCEGNGYNFDVCPQALIPYALILMSPFFCSLLLFILTRKKQVLLIFLSVSLLVIELSTHAYTGILLGYSVSNNPWGF